MHWMDNGGKSCLKEFDLALFLWPLVGKSHPAISICFPRASPTLQCLNSWRWKTCISAFYSWNNKSIHSYAFPTLSVGHALLCFFESSWSLCCFELLRRMSDCYLSQIITLNLPPLPSLWTLTTYTSQRAKGLMFHRGSLWLVTHRVC